MEHWTIVFEQNESTLNLQINQIQSDYKIVHVKIDCNKNKIIWLCTKVQIDISVQKMKSNFSLRLINLSCFYFVNFSCLGNKYDQLCLTAKTVHFTFSSHSQMIINVNFIFWVRKIFFATNGFCSWITLLHHFHSNSKQYNCSE